MRTANSRSSSRGVALLTALHFAVVFGAVGCSSEENLVGTAQADLFSDGCGEALAQVIRDHPEWGEDPENPRIRAIEREREDGVDVWGVELESDVEIEFEDDGTCSVLEIEVGEDDDEGGDDDD